MNRKSVEIFVLLVIACTGCTGKQENTQEGQGLSPETAALVPYIKKGLEAVVDFQDKHSITQQRLPSFGDGIEMPLDPLGHPLKFRRWTNGLYAVCADGEQIDVDLKGLYLCGIVTPDNQGTASIKFLEDIAVVMAAPPSMDTYKQLRIGMSYEQVVALFGEPGKELWSTHSETEDTVKYRWGSAFHNAEVRFEKNVVDSYEQIGLE